MTLAPLKKVLNLWKGRHVAWVQVIQLRTNQDLCGTLVAVIERAHL